MSDKTVPKSVGIIEENFFFSYLAGMFYRSKRKWSLSAMSAFYLISGVMHFAVPSFYLELMPDWLPLHELCNWIAGGLEITLGTCLLFPRIQSFAAWSIGIMLLLFLLTIHIPLIFRFNGFDDAFWWINLARIPIQYFLIRWSLNFVGKRPVKLVNGLEEDSMAD